MGLFDKIKHGIDKGVGKVTEPIKTITPIVTQPIQHIVEPIKQKVQPPLARGGWVLIDNRQWYGLSTEGCNARYGLLPEVLAGQAKSDWRGE